MERPTRRSLAAGLTSAALARPAAAAPLRRVVSLSPCLDTCLVHLADRRQIAALSQWSRQAGGSTITEIARTLPFTYGDAEAVALLKPELVISSIPTPIPLQQALPRLGIPLTLFQVPDTVEESLAQVREVAGSIGQFERGERLVARIRAALATAAPPAGARQVSALVFQRDGFVSGPGTLMDEMLTRTGFSNAARRYGMTASGNLPLEQLIADPPELLLSDQPSGGAVSWGERMLRHPALRAVRGRMRAVPFPAALVYCGGPVLIRTAATLASARLQVLGMRG